MSLQEVVSIGVAGGGPHLSPRELEANAAPHVSPQQFHALLEQVSDKQHPTLLLDVRNLYETRVGHFAKVRSFCHVAPLCMRDQSKMDVLFLS